MAIDEGCIGLSASLNSKTVEVCGSTMKANCANVPMPTWLGGRPSVRCVIVGFLVEGFSAAAFGFGAGLTGLVDCCRLGGAGSSVGCWA